MSNNENETNNQDNSNQTSTDKPNETEIPGTTVQGQLLTNSRDPEKTKEKLNEDKK